MKHLITAILILFSFSLFGQRINPTTQIRKGTNVDQMLYTRALDSALVFDDILTIMASVGITPGGAAQTLSIEEDTLSISGGNSVILPSGSSLTEEQVQDYAWSVLSGSQSLISVTYEDVADEVTFEVEDSLSYYVNDVPFLTSETDGSITNELQDIDLLDLSNDSLRISLTQDADVYKVDLSGLGGGGGGTDDQTIDQFDISNDSLRISLENDGEGLQKVDLSPYLDNTDAQNLSWSSPNLSITNGTGADLSSLLDNTDEQTVDTFTIFSNILTMALENDQEAPYTVDLSSYLDNTDAQVLDVAQLSGDNLELSLSGDGEATKTIDLSGYTNTDAQNLSWSSPNLSITNGTGADLSSLLNTDDQTVDTFSITSNTLTLALESDGEAPYTVSLAAYLDNTDAQALDEHSLSGTDLQLSISGDGEAIQTVDLSPLVPAGVTDNGTTLTADFNDEYAGKIIQIDLNDAASATANLNNLRTGVVYTVHFYNATDTDVTLASNEAETNWYYIDGTTITSDLIVIAEGDMVTFYFDGTDVWTTVQP